MTLVPVPPPLSFVFRIRNRFTWLDEKPIARNEGLTVLLVSVVEVSVEALPSMAFEGSSLEVRPFGNPYGRTAAVQSRGRAQCRFD